MAIEKLKSSHRKPASKKMPAKKRTSAGTIPKKVRDKTATLSDDRFPIFDEKSAKAALKLRGHGTSEKEREKVVRRAAKYVPEQARRAKMADKKRAR